MELFYALIVVVCERIYSCIKIQRPINQKKNSFTVL